MRSDGRTGKQSEDGERDEQKSFHRRSCVLPMPNGIMSLTQ